MSTKQLETLFLLLQRYPSIVVPLSTRHWHVALFGSKSNLVPTSKQVAIVGTVDTVQDMIGFIMFGVVR